MIKEIREQEPFIHLGFNKQEAFYSVGEEVTVWQDKLYISDYDVTTVATGSNLVTQTNNKTVLTFDTSGEYEAIVNVSNRDKDFNLVSNTIKINVDPLDSARFSNQNETMTVEDEDCTETSTVTITPLSSSLNETFVVVPLLGRFIVTRIVINALQGLTKNLLITWSIT